MPLNLQPGQAVWSQPLGPHTLENVGTSPLHLISVEIKNQDVPAAAGIRGS